MSYIRTHLLRAGVLALLSGHVLMERADAVTVRGVVFEDRNGNGRRDDGDRGLPDVGVSNGRDIAVSDRQGRYELTVDEDDIVFVLKPRGFMVTVDALNLPRFYHVHKPAGLAVGAHVVEVRTRDMFGQVDHARRIVRVEAAPY